MMEGVVVISFFFEHFETRKLDDFFGLFGGAISGLNFRVCFWFTSTFEGLVLNTVGESVLR